MQTIKQSVDSVAIEFSMKNKLFSDHLSIWLKKMKLFVSGFYPLAFQKLKYNS